MLAMVESVDHVTETAKRLPGLPIVALVETARGVQHLDSIAASRSRSIASRGSPRGWFSSRISS